MNEEAARKQRTRWIVISYPIVVLLISGLINLLVLDVNPMVVATPSKDCIVALTITAALLVFNHTWLMTSTELTRVRYTMFATPEDQAASGVDDGEASEQGVKALERRYNAHRNTTENTAIFCLLAPVFVLISPAVLAVYVWIVAFGIARIGYTWSYLAGNVQARGLFMSLGLLATYGMASYLVISLLM
jgi:uncharacterized MAPEG superfamily protein